MALTPEQKQKVAQWVAAGDNLSAVQSKLSSEFQISMTFMDVRFLVDDLDLEIKDPKPSTPPVDLSKPAAKPAPAPAAQEEPAAASDEAYEDEAELADPAVPPAAGGVSVTMDRIVLIPGAMASGTATFSDGVTAKWIVDNQGRPGFTEVSQPGYRPTPADAQAFMRELTHAIQSQGY